MKFRTFMQTGNVKFAAAAAFIGFPMIGLYIMNSQVIAWARPKLLDIRVSDNPPFLDKYQMKVIRK
jgi:hypothetical protein